MSLPEIRRDASVVMTPRTLARASRAQQKAELAVFEHGLARQAQSMMDQIDTNATGDALRHALDEELALLDHGLQRAGGSAAAVELVSRKVDRFQSLNDSRQLRRFSL